MSKSACASGRQANLSEFFKKRGAPTTKKRGAPMTLQTPQRPEKCRAMASSGSEEITPAKPELPGLTRSAPAKRKDWFSDLFGFSETEYTETKNWLRVHETEEGQVLESLVNGARFGIGSLECPSLGALRARAKLFPGKLRVRNEIGDVAAKHAAPENRWATFQVASQFNCLEFVSPSVKPEHGITGYICDRTQGPACSISCGPATAYRNYFAPVGPQEGQTAERQIDNLEDFSTEVGNRPKGRYFQVQGGYTLGTSRRLAAMNRHLRNLDEQARNKLREALRIGVHADVQVTSFGWGAKRLNEDQYVTQVFGSACSVAYNHESSQQDWAPVASLILEASYEATLLAAVEQARKHAGEGGSRRVFLTCLGGGVFGNSMEWITAAMRHAFQQLRDHDLDVRIITYAGAPARELLALEREFQ